MGNSVVHFELTSPDSEATARFYSELFGWHTEALPELTYHTIDTHAGKGINGGFAQTIQPDQPSFVTFYVEVDDLQGTLDKAESLGAKTVVPVTEIPNVVTFAQFTDPQGNVIGAIQSDPAQAGQGGVSSGDNPAVDWFEVQGPDPKALWSFYSELFGWEITDRSREGFVYGLVSPGGRGIPGGIGSSLDGQPHVTNYAHVDDLHKYLEVAESLGGKTIMQPDKVDETTSIAVFLDPQGNAFGLYTGM